MIYNTVQAPKMFVRLWLRVSLLYRKWPIWCCVFRV